MKRTIFLLIIMLLVAFTAFSQTQATDGGVTYSLKDDGTAEVVGTTEDLPNEVTIPATIDTDSQGYTVSKIAKKAFENCNNLTSITIPESVTEIGNYAFAGCGNLKSIEIPSNVNSIGTYAFQKCTQLSSVIFAARSQIRSIENYTFCKCGNLKSIEIPSNVKSIGTYAFQNCSQLSSVTFAENSPLTSIGNLAFDGCKILSSIEIPSSVTSIGTSAFYNCEQLRSVTFAENSPLTSIGNSAFYGCKILSSIEIPSGVTSIGTKTFYNCSQLSNVKFAENSSLTSIGNSAFNGCKILSSIEIPSGVTSIGSNTFDNCSQLSNVKFAENSSLTSIGNYAFRGCKILSSIEIPSGVTSIGTYAFYNCSLLGSVTIADDAALTSIGNNAFSGCNNLKSIFIPANVTTIGSDAFYKCTQLSSVTFAEKSSLTSIGTSAFNNCVNISSITIPDEVQRIDAKAFQNVKNVNYNGPAEGSPWGALAINGGDEVAPLPIDDDDNVQQASDIEQLVDMLDNLSNIDEGEENNVDVVLSGTITNKKDVAKLAENDFAKINIEDVPLFSSVGGNYSGSFNADDAEIKDLILKTEGALFQNIAVEGEVSGLYFDNAAVVINADNSLWKFENDTLKINLIANKVEGKLDFGYVGKVLLSNELEELIANQYSDKQIVVYLVGEIGKDATVRGVFFDRESAQEYENKMMNVHQIAPMQYGEGGTGLGDCKLAATFNEFDSKAGETALTQYQYPDAELNKSTRYFTLDEFEAGAASYWLNWTKKGYTGEYKPTWGVSKDGVPVKVKNPADATRAVIYKPDADAAEIITAAPHFAKQGDNIVIKYTTKPDKITVDGVAITLGEGSASFTMPAKDVEVEIKYNKAGSEAPLAISTHTANGISITAVDGAIKISGNHGTATVIDIAGNIVAQSSKNVITIAKSGIYIVRVNGEVAKIVVK